MGRKKMGVALLLVVLLSALFVGDRLGFAQEKDHNRCRQHHFGKFSDWSEPVNLGPIINSEFNDQHPAISPDGLSLYITSDRPGSFGKFDIYVSQRASRDDNWGPPENLGSIINSGFSDSVPTFSADGHRMYFCSSRPGGFADSPLTNIWVSFREDATDDFAWQPPTILGSGVNTKKGECGPTIFEDRLEEITTLYFTRCASATCTFGNPNEKDNIYASTLHDDGTFGTAVPVPELNSGFRDTRTAIRNDGLEFFLTSSRPGGLGSLDLWVSKRETTLDAWSTPVNLGPTVNTKDIEGAPALSCDGTMMYFYSNRPGGFGKNDLYVTTRAKLPNKDKDDNNSSRE